MSKLDRTKYPMDSSGNPKGSYDRDMREYLEKEIEQLHQLCRELVDAAKNCDGYVVGFGQSTDHQLLHDNRMKLRAAIEKYNSVVSK